MNQNQIKKPHRHKGGEKSLDFLCVWQCVCVLSFFLFLSGCAYLASEHDRPQQVQTGSLGLYVRFCSPAKEEISFTVKDIQLEGADGALVSRPVNQPLEAGSDGRQVFIEVKVPTGSYQKIGLSFTGASINRSGETILLESQEGYTFLDVPFLITPKRTTNAYVNLEVKSQKKGSDTGLLFSPRLSQGRKPAGVKALMLYVTNTDDNTVSVLDRLTNSTITVIQVGKAPKGIVVNPRGIYAYVANSGSNSVSIIDTMTNELEEEAIDLPLGIAPSRITITSDGKYVFTANMDSDNVSMIDTDLKKSIDTFDAGHQPVDLEVSSSGKWLYVTNQGSHDIYVIGIESHRLADRIPLQSEPAGIVVSGDGFSSDLLFVANFGSSSVFLFDIDLTLLENQGKAGNDPGYSVKKSSLLQAEYGPDQIVLDEDRGRLFVTNRKDNSVSSFRVPLLSAAQKMPASAGIQESRYRTGKSPCGLALDSARNYLYVINSAEDSLSVIDLRQEQLIESIRVGRAPFGIDGIDLIRK
ncbi:MAG: YncE family protein [bacterium]